MRVSICFCLCHFLLKENQILNLRIIFSLWAGEHPINLNCNSSKNSMQGAAAAALLKILRTPASLCPIYLFSSSGPFTEINRIPAADAAHRTCANMQVSQAVPTIVFCNHMQVEYRKQHTAKHSRSSNLVKRSNGSAAHSPDESYHIQAVHKVEAQSADGVEQNAPTRT